MTDKVESIEKKPSPRSNVYWYAFLIETATGKPCVMFHKNQKDLKKMLNESQERHELQMIVKGRGYAFKVQKSFAFGAVTHASMSHEPATA